eukprot:3993086-Pleurochrysis_carterae.AAC.1
MELTRSNLVACGAPTGFWTYAVAHAVDVLNRTTGPPRSAVSSFEALTGDKSRTITSLRLPGVCRQAPASLLEDSHGTSCDGSA